MSRQLAAKSFRLPVVLFALACSPLVHAVGLSGSQTAAGVWSYDLTFAPLDNYSVFPQDTTSTNLTTITLTGLFGVTAASGPSSTSFADIWLDSLNRNWTAQVLDGGTTVKWTHVGPGTGNFPDAQYLYGFKVLASGARNGAASFATSGFTRDVSYPLPDGSFKLDVSGTVAGPVAAVPEPESSAMLLAGMALLGFVLRRKPA